MSRHYQNNILRERDREIDTHVIDHDHQDHKPSVLQQNSSKERSRRNNKKKKVYANASLFSLRAEEEEDEEEDFSLENSKDEIRYINIIVVRLERFFCVIKGFLIWLVLV
jgi:metal-dependent hydrolase (beta-lactamase superfamily II)